jgi:hypothetical protein
MRLVSVPAHGTGVAQKQHGTLRFLKLARIAGQVGRHGIRKRFDLTAMQKPGQIVTGQEANEAA